jgi:uncharacterized protein YdeI (YjbR/CyaY-like superfamily)
VEVRLPIYHPAELAAWRAWLVVNHGTTRGVWVASWRRVSERDPVVYEELVEEAICFGWIDSTVNILGDERALQLMTPQAQERLDTPEQAARRCPGSRRGG